MNNPISSAYLNRWVDASLSSPVQCTDSDAPDSGLPAWILLDQVAQIDYDGRENATTAKTRTIFGTVKVTFFAANPPMLSNFSVHCPGLTKLDFLGEPRIHFSLDNLALISVGFACGSKTEYFFYRCGHGKLPKLEHLKDVGDYLKEVKFVAAIGFLPCSDNTENFVLVALSFTLVPDQYKLHVFRSEQHVWSSKLLSLGRHKKLLNVEKVMAMGRNIGFADLWNGILVCDVSMEDMAVRFIPFPPLLPGNKSRDQLGSARLVRDVMCTNGVIRCVEIEHIIRERPRKPQKLQTSTIKPKDLSETDVFFDRDMTYSKEEDTEEVILEYLGWNVLVCRRTVSSSTCWYRDVEMFSVDKIIVTNEAHKRLLTDIGGSNCTLKDFFTAAPTLPMDWTNSLHMISMLKTRSDNCNIIVIDMQRRTLEDMTPILTQRPNFSSPTYVPSDISKYLSTGSGGAHIVEQDALDSSNPQLNQETEDLCTAAIRDNFPRARRYSNYSTITSSALSQCSYDQWQSMAEVVRPSWQKSSPPSDESRIVRRDGSWSASSFLPISEGDSSCITFRGHHQWLTRHSNSPTTPSSIASCYANHQQTPKESVHSCITYSGNRCPGVEYNRDSSPVTPSAAFSSLTSYQQQQPLQKDTYPLLQSSPLSLSCSSTSENYGSYHHVSIIPSEARYWNQPLPLMWSSSSLQKRQLQAGAHPFHPFQSTAPLRSLRFGARETS